MLASNRCPACSCQFRPIPPSGPHDATIVFIGERPGKRENERQEVFVGPTGAEFDSTYLLGCARLHREDVYCTNTVKCWAESNRTPSDKEVDSCSMHFLPTELKRVNPDVVVLMGGRACRIADRRLRIDTVHGIPYFGSLLNGAWEGMIWPSYHPSLGMHNTSKMSNLLEDFRNLGAWLKGQWTPVEPDVHEKDYGLIRTPRDFNAYVLGGGVWLETPPVDTETHDGEKWSVQFSIRPHSGRMILADNREVLDLFQRYLYEFNAAIALHNAPQDLDTLAKMRIHPPSFCDTMQESFQLCTTPQGLKPLAYRLLGVEMRSWEDVVWPASINAITNWMEDAHSLAADNLALHNETPMLTRECVECGGGGRGDVCRKRIGKSVCGGEMRAKIKRERTSSALEKILKHIITYAAKNEDYNPWNALSEMMIEGLRGEKPGEGELDYLQDELGAMPRLGIGNCELEEAVRYGASDSDHTGQVRDALVTMRNSGQWEIADEDIDQ